jgi:hypothetical protein
MERRLNFIEKEILKNDIPVLEPSYIPNAPNPKDISRLRVSDKLKILMEESYFIHPV